MFIMDRMTVYVPLFPAVGAGTVTPARLLALGFEPSGLAGGGEEGALGDRLSALLGLIRHWIGRECRGRGRGPSLARALSPWSARRALPLEPIPDLCDCDGAGLPLALGLALGRGPARDDRLLAFGRLEPRRGLLTVAPLADYGPLLDLLESLGPQPRPLLCLLPRAVGMTTIDLQRLCALARSNLCCAWVDSLTEAIDYCLARGLVPGLSFPVISP
jgi:hypothetical protein